MRIKTVTGEVSVTASRERTLLAMLLLHANQPVSIGRLIDAIWDTEPPQHARNQVQRCVSMLRRRLAETGIGDNGIATEATGYRQLVDATDLDLLEFRRLVAEAREAGRTWRLTDSISHYRAALGLWRGPVVADVESILVQRLAAAVDEERMRALEERLDLELVNGAAGELVAELTALVAQHPHREALHRALMLVLYRAGRQADALAAYRRVRQLLHDDLGVEPGSELQELHRRILRGDPPIPPAITEAPGPADPAVPPASAVVPPASAVVPVPRQLPAAPSAFTGRAGQLARLDKTVAEPARTVVITAVDGGAGVGKTALALQWAHRTADRFPDGQLYADLRGYALRPPLAPIEVLALFLRALGIAGERVPVDVDEAAALYRSLLAGKQVLVVLDNAASVEQVRPLLPGAGGCLVMVTSRNDLGGLVARDGAHRLRLDVLTAAEAHTLVSHMLGAGRVRSEPEAVAELCQLCGHLPLALRVAAANLTARSGQDVADYVALLRERDRLAALTVDGDPHSAVAATFDLSYTRLPDPARRLFRLLGLVPGADVTLDAAAALAGLSPATAAPLLAALTRAHLLDERTSGRYACHDLLRAYAAHRASEEEAEPDRDAARRRLLDWYLGTAEAADRILYPEMLRLPATGRSATSHPPPAFDNASQARAWLDAESANLLSAITSAATHGPRWVAWRLADCLRGFWWQSGYLVDWRTGAEAAGAAARSEGDRHGQAAVHMSLGIVQDTRGRPAEALEHLYTALDLAGQVGWDEGRAAALGNCAIICWTMGRLDQAVAHLTESLAINRELGRLGGQAVNLDNLGGIHLDLGHLSQAARCLTEAVAMYHAIGSPASAYTALRELGAVARYLGRLEEARDHATQALALCRERGYREDEIHALHTLAAVHRDAGRYADALQAAQASAHMADGIGDRRAQSMARNTLGTVRRRLGRPRQALDDHRYALDLARDLQDSLSEIDGLLGLAAAHHDLDQPGPARTQAGQALERARERGYRIHEGQALTLVAELHLGQYDHTAAGRYAELALENHRQTGYRLGQARTHLVLGRIRQQTGDYGSARSHWQEAHARFADIGAPESAQSAALITEPTPNPMAT